ncbi:Gfo/Idh/MocA family protein [Homoserinibacter sp. GY 40078]|uniref:Gfo/Idh/MocA family protein n=1 Tax=Homoserinibacter sp. GY 40078 TaxID=2603275 RepID=UPI0011C859EE|nr:Gfo/Idh/MocA family oxidoreductase [Homoserinibacter sp. GY 40078]TXK18427.1 Gfo/Idh/MocA family oxidoreductase [Homoserinibacter sp. GY 40078]
MTERLRWGILGTGGIARMFTSDLLLTGHDVVAVGSRTRESAEEFAAAHGIARAHGSYEELVADPEVDAIYVATPHPYHAANATLALQHGKHVLVEKPFTINEAEARSVVELAAASGLVVLEAMWTRWLPHMLRVREILASGALGEVRALIADHDQKISTDPEGRLQNPALGGGALLDLGIYPVSFAWDVFGAPAVVHAIASSTPTGVDRQTAILFGYPGGEQAVIHTQLDARGPSTAVIVGTEARIEIDEVWYAPTSFSLVSSDGTVLERYESSVEGRGMQFQADELERLVAAGASGGEILPPEETVAIMATLDEIRRQIGLVYPSERG